MFADLLALNLHFAATVAVAELYSVKEKRGKRFIISCKEPLIARFYHLFVYIVAKGFPIELVHYIFLACHLVLNLFFNGQKL